MDYLAAFFALGARFFSSSAAQMYPLIMLALYTPDSFDASMIEEQDAIAFGCPSMGCEELEDTEFEPMFSSCREKLGGKKVALFGSYGWGDGEWMRDWEETCREAGAVLVCESVICNEAPDDEAADACRALGEVLAGQ